MDSVFTVVVSPGWNGGGTSRVIVNMWAGSFKFLLLPEIPPSESWCSVCSQCSAQAPPGGQEGQHRPEGAADEAEAERDRAQEEKVVILATYSH